MKITNYETENIELRAKCDDLKRTGTLVYTPLRHTHSI